MAAARHWEPYGVKCQSPSFPLFLHSAALPFHLLWFFRYHLLWFKLSWLISNPLKKFNTSVPTTCLERDGQECARTIEAGVPSEHAAEAGTRVHVQRSAVQFSRSAVHNYMARRTSYFDSSSAFLRTAAARSADPGIPELQGQAPARASGSCAERPANYSVV